MLEAAQKERRARRKALERKLGDRAEPEDDADLLSTNPFLHPLLLIEVRRVEARFAWNLPQ